MSSKKKKTVSIRVAIPKKKGKKKASSTLQHVRGSGDYSSSSGSKPYTSSSKWGKWATRAAGLGGDFLSHIFGKGDYAIKYNSLMSAGGPPEFSTNKGDRSTIVTHREYIGDIIGSVAFVNRVYPINMTNTTLFPWLSSIARKYEEYRIHGCIAEFNSTSGDSVGATNTSLGSVIIGTHYDATALPFSSKIAMENHQFTTSCKPSVSFIHGIECKPSLTVAPQLFTGTAVPVTNSVRDPHLTTLGVLQVATVGQPVDGANLGELWLSFQIELLKPCLDQSLDVMMLKLDTATPTSTHFFQGGTTIVPTENVGAGPGELLGPLGKYTLVNDTITWTDSRLSGRSFYVVTEVDATTVASGPALANTNIVYNGGLGGVDFSYTGTAQATVAVPVTFTAGATSWSLTITTGATTGAATTRFMISLLV